LAQAILALSKFILRLSRIPRGPAAGLRVK